MTWFTHWPIMARQTTKLPALSNVGGNANRGTRERRLDEIAVPKFSHNAKGLFQRRARGQLLCVTDRRFVFCGLPCAFVRKVIASSCSYPSLVALSLENVGLTLR